MYVHEIEKKNEKQPWILKWFEVSSNRVGFSSIAKNSTHISLAVPNSSKWVSLACRVAQNLTLSWSELL